MKIFISTKEEQRWVESTSFEKEEHLQKYITDHPDSIPLSEYKEQTKLKIIAREFVTPHKERIDHIGIDQDGDIYLIETKHYTNSDKRHIVSQVLDYGATLSSDYSFDDFVDQIENWIRNNTGTTSLQELIQQNYELTDESAAEVMEEIEDNFVKNNFKFIVLMDQTDEKIKKFVRFLNENSNFTIFLIEYRRYVDKDREIIIPKLYGVDSAKVKGSRFNWNWTEDDFFKLIESDDKLDENQKRAIRKFTSLIKESLKNPRDGKIVLNKRKKPALITIFYRFSQTRYLFNIKPDGKMKINFEFSSNQEEQFKRNFRNLLSKIKGLEKIALSFSEKEKVQLDVREWTPVADEIFSVIKKLCLGEK